MPDMRRPSERLLDKMLVLENEHGRYVGGQFYTSNPDADRLIFERLLALRPDFERIGGVGQLTGEFKKAAQIYHYFMEKTLTYHGDWRREIPGTHLFF